ncbi:MAG: DUF305 domain-containing protein [Chloroflexota bacterium]|nr:DUF305 domain-containing protein [Chloroflexota bacterium]
MTGDLSEAARAEADATEETASLRPWSLFPVLLIAALVAGAAVLAWQLWPRLPGDDSVDAGFARDMATHHEQAVEMALIARDRTENEAIKYLATDVVQSQATQRGMMLGWLDVWGLPPTGAEPAMAWMGHPTRGRMPGMASREEIEQLEHLPLAQADAEFLRLMIRHHQSGVSMAQAGLERAGRDEVRRLARAIAQAQTSEVQQMQEILDAMASVPAPHASPEPEGMEGMGTG